MVKVVVVKTKAKIAEARVQEAKTTLDLEAQTTDKEVKAKTEVDKAMSKVTVRATVKEVYKVMVKEMDSIDMAMPTVLVTEKPLTKVPIPAKATIRITQLDKEVIKIKEETIYKAKL